MPRYTSSHRYALLAIAVWATLLFIYQLAPWAPHHDSEVPSESATSHDSAAAGRRDTEWQVFPLRPLHENHGRHGTIQISTTDDGLVVRGAVDGPEPKWPLRHQSWDMHDFLEITLADAMPVALPPIGWGNQFGFTHLASANDPNDVQENSPELQAKESAVRRQWYEAQLPYRQLLTTLFERRWRIAPDRVEEVAATAAFAKLSVADQQALSLLAVHGSPTANFARTASATVTFEVVIPWNAFPPLRSLVVQDLKLQVATFRPESTTGLSPVPPSYRFAERSTLHGLTDPMVFHCQPARTYTLTPACFTMSDALVAGEWFPSDDAVRYIRPGSTTELDRVLVVDNTAKGYQYEPDPGSRSPIVQEARFWSHQLPDGSLLAGPPLTWKHQDTTLKSTFVVASTDQLEIRSEAGGNLLIKHGPREAWSFFGSGQCGGCPRLTLQIYHVERTHLRFNQLLTIHEVIDGDGDLAISPDWKIATFYQAHFDATTMAYPWLQFDYIRPADGTPYVKQLAQTIAVPPTPRRFDYSQDK